MVLCGPTGCGKSTLLMAISGLIPHSVEGRLTGRVTVAGRDTRETPVAELATVVGMVFQNPEAQISQLTVEDEIAFGLENLCLPRPEIGARLEETLELLGIEGWREAITSRLSAGQKQLLAIAATLAMKPQVLVLDEPLSDLDPQGKRLVMEAVANLNRRLGMTIILAEHNLDEVAHLATRVVVLDRGRIVLDGEPREVLSNYASDLAALGVGVPQLAEASLRLGLKEVALTPEELAPALKSWARWHRKGPEEKAGNGRSGTAVEARELGYTYPDGTVALQEVSFSIGKEEVVALVGGNGAGKSTWAKLLIGLLRPTAGDLCLFGRSVRRQRISGLASQVGFLFQNPDHQLFCDTVEAEVALGLSRLPMDAREREVAGLLRLTGLERYRRAHPFALSRGERQRVAVATVLAAGPKVLVLDEPTTGQDWKQVRALLELVREEVNRGATAIVISHNMRLVAEYCPRMVVLNQGEVRAVGPSRALFSDPSSLADCGLAAPPLVRASQLAGINPVILLPDEIRSE